MRSVPSWLFVVLLAATPLAGDGPAREKIGVTDFRVTGCLLEEEPELPRSLATVVVSGLSGCREPVDRAQVLDARDGPFSNSDRPAPVLSSALAHAHAFSRLGMLPYECRLVDRDTLRNEGRHGCLS